MNDYCSITVATHGLSRLIRFVSRFTTHLCKNFVNRLHLVLQISKILSQNFFAFHLNTPQESDFFQISTRKYRIFSHMDFTITILSTRILQSSCSERMVTSALETVTGLAPGLPPKESTQGRRVPSHAMPPQLNLNSAAHTTPLGKLAATTTRAVFSSKKLLSPLLGMCSSVKCALPRSRGPGWFKEFY